MNYLQYTSKEMYSSTDLIRKSKSIFDKLNKKEIEKAIILRDGKPSFMLLDFETYENIMIEYMQLKDNAKTNSTKEENHSNKIVEKENLEDDQNEQVAIENTVKEEINDDDVRKALEEIDNLYSSLSTKENTKEQPPLKEFWE